MIDPIYFSIPGEKPRLVFDFYGTDYPQELPKRIKADGEFVKKIRIGVHYEEKTKTRIVVDLVPLVDVEVERRFAENGLIFEIVISQKKHLKPAVLPREKTDEQKSDVATVETEKAEESKDTDVSIPAVAQKENNIEEEKTVSVPDNEDLDFHEAPLGPQDEVVERPSVTLEKVTFERTTNQKEMILFRLSGFQTPVIYSPEGEEIRVVCEFLNASLGEEIVRNLRTNGDLIKKVFISERDDTSKVRVVLALNPQYNYDLKQVLFKEDNLFVIIISSLGNK